MNTFTYVLSWPKKLLWFLSKHKRHIFHFHHRFHWTTYSLFCSITLCHFLGNFIIPSYTDFFFLFEQRTVPGSFLQSSRELKFFPLRQFCKDQNKWKFEGVMSSQHSRWFRTSQQSCNIFLPGHQRNMQSCIIPDGLLLFSWSVVSDSLQPHGLHHASLLCPSPSPRIWSTHVHWTSDAIQPSHPLFTISPPTFNLSQHQGLF